MAEFTDDLYDDQPTDTDLVRQLRAVVREKDKALKQLTTKLETLEKKDRASTLGSILESKGVPAKVAGLLPADLEATPEAVEKWLDDYADVFNIERGGETEQVNQQNQQGDTQAGQATQETAASGSGAGTGISAEEQAAFAAVQRTEQGAQTPPLGLERVRQELADIRSLPAEQAFQKLKELGVMSG